MMVIPQRWQRLPDDLRKEYILLPIYVHWHSFIRWNLRHLPSPV